MKKKLLSVLLCGAMVLSLASCGNKKSSSAANALEKVKSAGKLTVACSPDFAPYEFEDPSKTGQDSYAGADIDFAKYLAEQLGVKVEIIPMDFDACITAVAQGKADCSISGIYPSEKRKQTVDFTDSYFDDSKQYLVIKKDNKDKLKTTADFDGQTVCAQNGAAQADMVGEQMPKAKCQLVTKTTDGIQMVKSGKASAILLQAVMAESVIASDDSLAISDQTYSYDESQLVVAIPKNESELKDAMNEAIKKVNADKMYDKWIVDAQALATKITAK